MSENESGVEQRTDIDAPPINSLEDYRANVKALWMIIDDRDQEIAKLKALLCGIKGQIEDGGFIDAVTG